MGTAAGGSGSIVTFTHGADDGELEGGEKKKVITAKPIGKYALMIKLGLRLMIRKVLC